MAYRFMDMLARPTRRGLSEDEKKLYNAVTEYVERHYNKALEKEKRNVPSSPQWISLHLGEESK